MLPQAQTQMMIMCAPFVECMGVEIGLLVTHGFGYHQECVNVVGGNLEEPQWLCNSCEAYFVWFELNPSVLLISITIFGVHIVNSVMKHYTRNLDF